MEQLHAVEAKGDNPALAEMISNATHHNPFRKNQAIVQLERMLRRLEHKLLSDLHASERPPSDLVPTNVAVSEYETTSRTILRYIQDGKLQDYRAPGKATAKHMLSRAELRRHFSRRR